MTLLALAWGVSTTVGAQPFDSGTLGVAQDRQNPERPRFRAGANLVRVDAYVAKDGVALTDLRPDEIEVYEDDKLQTIESVELVKARNPIAQSARINPTTLRDMRQDAADATRLFTLFFDRLHVSIAGAYHANQPIVQTLDRVIGQDDMVGVMTPEMSASSITYSRRTTNIERFVTDTWAWGIKDQVATFSPQEQAFYECYPEHIHGYIAGAMVARLREQQTLDALDGLVTHLEGLRPERKFVMVFTEGWSLYQRDERLARPIDDRVPGQEPLRVDPLTGAIAKPGAPDSTRGQTTSYQACERQRAMLANVDHLLDFRTLLQRANRANVSFYPIDARGLIVFDQPTRFDLPPWMDQAFLRKRHEDLRMMALQTDGLAVLNSTNDIAGAMKRIFADVGSYYLLGYYSTNTRLDGKFRRIRVEVKRPDVDVRARPGYLAPTEAEARAAGGAPVRPGAAPPPPPPAPLMRALDAIAPGRGNLPVRIQASGARSSIRAVVELDAATAKLPEWMSGGVLRLVINPERGTTAAAQTITRAIQPGQRSIPIDGTDTPLPPGRYSVRAELTPKTGRLPIQVTTFATVPAESEDLGTGALALRRGPSTGLAYVPTADPRFRRTERLRVEVPLLGAGHAGTARLLTRTAQPMPLVATFTTRVDDEQAQALGVAEINLAPLAEGEYVLELSIVKDGKTGIAAYGFRIIP